MLTVCTWVWGTKYGPEYVERLAAGLNKHIRQPYRFAVYSVADEDKYLTDAPGCFARLRMFDPQWQRNHGIDDRLVCLDLDVVITGGLDALFDRPEPFVILGGANSSNPNPFNGSIMMLRARAHPELWTDFNLEKSTVELKEAGKVFAFADDQGWIWHKLANAATWATGRQSGIYSFRKRGWPSGDALPSGARLVAFPGHRDPSKFTHLDWVKENWIA